MAKEKHKEELMYCPVAGFFSDLENVFRRRSTFLHHLNNSRIEFLKAIRALFDQRIDSLEKTAAKSDKKTSKIEGR